MRILGFFFTALGVIMVIIGLIRMSVPKMDTGDNLLFLDNYSWVLAFISLIVGAALLLATRGK